MWFFWVPKFFGFFGKRESFFRVEIFFELEISNYSRLVFLDILVKVNGHFDWKSQKIWDFKLFTFKTK